MAGNRNSGGHNKKPQELKELEGTAQKCRTNDNAPVLPDLLDIGMPEHLQLTEKGEMIWNSLSKDLTTAGILKATDIQAFAVYCNEYARYLELAAEVRLEGVIIETATGPKKSPKVIVMYDALRIVNSYQGKFGLTPADRSRISVEKPKEEETGITKLIK